MTRSLDGLIFLESCIDPRVASNTLNHRQWGSIQGFFIEVKTMDKKWYLLARNNQYREEPDNVFIESLSDIELLHFDLEVKRAASKVKIERESRGI